MEQRFTELYRLPKNLFSKGSPVIIEAAVLQKDNKTEKTFVQIKFRNIINKAIVSCKISIKAYDNSNTESDISYTYDNLSAGVGTCFGAKTPIFIINISPDKFDVAVSEVVFEDGTKAFSESTLWAPVPKQSPITTVLPNYELIQQYSIDTGIENPQLPEITEDLFMCACGAINAQNTKCYSCGHTYDELLYKLNCDYLECQKNIRLQNEKIEQEKLLKEKKKKKIISIIVSIIVLLCIALLVFVYPIIKKSTNYETASKTLESGDYLKAAEQFEEIGNYKDSNEKVLLAKYLYLDNNKNKAFNCNYPDFDSKSYYNILKELVDKDYDDAKILYSDFCSFKLDAYFNDSEDSTDRMEEIPKSSPVYCHYRIIGIIPNDDGSYDDTFNVEFHESFPNGETNNNDKEDNYESGADYWIGWINGIYKNPKYGDAGTLKFDFYVNGEYIGTSSVELIKG